jgi:hypothetical protein
MLTGRVRVLYRHISISPPNADEVRSSFFTRANAVKLGIFSTIVASKGQEDIILATAKLLAEGRNVELLIAGGETGTYHRRLRDLVTQLQIADQVHFCGFLQDPYAAMRECDLIVICSREEGFGRTAVEGMLLEKPVVYTAVGGMLEEMVDGETGLSYTPKDVDRLVDQIEKLISNPDYGRVLGKRACNYAAERFSRDSYGRKVFQELQELCSPSATQVPMPRILIPCLVSGLQDAQRISNEQRNLLGEREAQLRAAETAGQDAQRVANEQQSLLGEREAQLRAAEAALQDAHTQIIKAERRAEVIENATFWRVTYPLRRMITRWPTGLRRAVRGTAKLAWWSLTLRLPSKLRQRRALLQTRKADVPQRQERKAWFHQR